MFKEFIFYFLLLILAGCNAHPSSNYVLNGQTYSYLIPTELVEGTSLFLNLEDTEVDKSSVLKIKMPKRIVPSNESTKAGRVSILIFHDKHYSNRDKFREFAKLTVAGADEIANNNQKYYSYQKETDLGAWVYYLNFLPSIPAGTSSTTDFLASTYKTKGFSVGERFITTKYICKLQYYFDGFSLRISYSSNSCPTNSFDEFVESVNNYLKTFSIPK